MKELLEKIQKVAEEIKIIEKDMKVGTGSSSYKAVSDTMVILKVKEAENNHKLISIPIKQDLISSEAVKFNKKIYNSAEVEEKLNYVDVIKMTVRIYNLENPEQHIDIESFARGLDSSDKGFGKASTYARKYALLNAYKIATGEDPDAEPSTKSTTITKDQKRITVVDYLTKNNEYCMEVTKHFSLESLDDLTDTHVNTIHNNLTKKGKL